MGYKKNEESDMGPNINTTRYPPFTGGEGDRLMTVQQLTEHHVDIANLKTDVHEIRTDVKAILQQMSQNRGGWKMFLLACCASGFVITAAISILSLIKG